ncbi:universal stress protein [Desulfopila sp. IMCC35006]|uniref:universal stress protein n=1 Tax=Desulfopila sp. IMCC35006 TaxID=2569542 RepID=UPI0010AC5D1F|nr:universal stress protein [Desulfopila sp. IMCC35006]TKB28184.1 universal stress protein [Desulfopila sp. IMCC35006]
MTPKILVPINDSPTAKRTIDKIIELQDRFPKKLTLLYVINSTQLAYRMIPVFQVDMVKENATRAGRTLLEQTDKKLQKAGFTNELMLEFGEPRDIITHTANVQDFQLLVIGRHEGGGEIRDVLFGSVANHVLHNVKCPVLLF